MRTSSSVPISRETAERQYIIQRNVHLLKVWVIFLQLLVILLLVMMETLNFAIMAQMRTLAFSLPDRIFLIPQQKCPARAGGALFP